MAQNMRRRLLGDALVEMGREIRAELSSRASGDMFGRADVDMTEIANEAIQRQADRNRDPQQGRTLFSEARRVTTSGDCQDQRQESGRGADAAAADAAPRREALALQRHAAHQENGVENGVRLTSEPDPAFSTQLSVALTRTCYIRNSGNRLIHLSVAGSGVGDGAASATGVALVSVVANSCFIGRACDRGLTSELSCLAKQGRLE